MAVAARQAREIHAMAFHLRLESSPTEPSGARETTGSRWWGVALAMFVGALIVASVSFDLLSDSFYDGGIVSRTISAINAHLHR